MYSSKLITLEKTYVGFFAVFLFASTIICNSARGNFFFHVAQTLFLVSLLCFPSARQRLFGDRQFMLTLAATAAFLIYYSVSALWSNRDIDVVSSNLTHSFYLLMFFCLFQAATRLGYKKQVLCALYGAIIVLTLLTFIMVDKHTLLENRLMSGFPYAPSNVIDLGGYMAVGMLCGLILAREYRNHLFFLPLPVLFLGLLLTQSRGPLFSLIASLLVFLVFKPKFNRHSLLWMAGGILVVAAALWLSGFASHLFERLEEAYQQSFIRFGIWLHALDLIGERPLWGWGFDKHLSFVNSLGDTVTTTHDLYLGILLKGGLAGFALFALMIACGLIQLRRHLQTGQKAEASLFIFSLLFYLTQGMFIIGNPQEYWVLFWLPLAVIVSAPQAGASR